MTTERWALVPVAEDIGARIRTQDNRITSHPIFVVEQKREYIVDPDYYGARSKWVDDEGIETKPKAKGYRHIYVHDVWEFVTACFTEQGCKDYLESNGHNLRDPRIYVHSGFRNTEWQNIRAMFSESPGSALLAEVLAARGEVTAAPRHSNEEDAALIRLFAALDKLGPAAEG